MNLRRVRTRNAGHLTGTPHARPREDGDTWGNNPTNFMSDNIPTVRMKGRVRIRQITRYEGRVLFNERTWWDKLLEKLGVRSEKAAWAEINKE